MKAVLLTMFQGEMTMQGLLTCLNFYSSAGHFILTLDLGQWGAQLQFSGDKFVNATKNGLFMNMGVVFYKLSLRVCLK